MAPNVSSRRLTAASLGFVHLLAGCEPSLISDEGGRGVNPPASPQSSGGAGVSPRWAANNPPPQPSFPIVDAGVATAVTGAPEGSQGGTPPWGSAGSQVATGAVTQAAPSVPRADAETPAHPPITEPIVGGSGLAPPGESCASPCRARWQQCFAACDQGRDAQCTAACDEPYRDCMRNCY
jgi:hypothetical protein